MLTEQERLEKIGRKIDAIEKVDRARRKSLFIVAVVGLPVFFLAPSAIGELVGAVIILVGMAYALLCGNQP